MVKVPEGVSFVDPRAQENMANCQKAGLPYLGYHFADMTSTPEDQVAAYMKVVGSQHLAVVDWEPVGVGPVDAAKWLARWDDGCLSVGRKTVCYASISRAEKIFDAGYQPSRGWWVADWLNLGYPDIVPGYLRSFAGVVLWQYSDTSHVKGINGKVDESVSIPGGPRFPFDIDETTERGRGCSQCSTG